MRITIVSSGFRGDVQPLVALGKGLQDSGHEVLMHTHDDFRSMVENHGLEFFSLIGSPSQLLSSELGHQWTESGANIFKQFRAFYRMWNKIIPPGLIETWESCRHADVIIGGGILFWLYDLADKLGVPYFQVNLFPVHPTSAFPPVILPQSPSLGGLYNRLAHWLVFRLFDLHLRDKVNRWRVETLGLAARKRMKMLDAGWSTLPVLMGISEHVLPKPKDWGSNIEFTGYLVLDALENFAPSDELADFLDSGPPPVSIGFGSVGMRDPKQMTEIAVKALEKTGQRGILIAGWGGLSLQNLPDCVFKLDSIPHDWLFPKMAAVVHQAGAGTTAMALRAGVPSVTVPFTPEQMFWGHRVYKLGVGAKPIPKKRITVDLLSRAIDSALNDQTIQTRAAALGQKIRAEDGVAKAVELINARLNE